MPNNWVGLGVVWGFFSEGVVVAEVFEVSGCGVGFELGGVEEGVVGLHHAVECDVGGTFVGGLCCLWNGLPAKFAVECFYHHGSAAEFAFGGISGDVWGGDKGFFEQGRKNVWFIFPTVDCHIALPLG